MNRVIVTAASVLSVSLVGWRSFMAMSASGEARLARETLREAVAAAATVRELKPLPATAIAPDVTDAELLRDIQRVLGKSGVVSGQIREISIDPIAVEMSAATGSSAGSAMFQKRTGRIAIQGVSLPQVGKVLADWQTILTPLRIEQIRFQRVTNSNRGGAEAPPLDVNISFAALTPEQPR
jgi:hypothetical protein